MKTFKAGDFTSGKMNEIFRSAAGRFSSGVKITHKQFGEYRLMSTDNIDVLFTEILQTNFGIFKSESTGKYVSCFNYKNIGDDEIDSCNARYYLDHFDGDVETMMLGYEVLNTFKEDIANLNIASLFDILPIRQMNKDREDSILSFIGDLPADLIDKMSIPDSVNDLKLVTSGMLTHVEKFTSNAFKALSSEDCLIMNYESQVRELAKEMYFEYINEAKSKNYISVAKENFDVIFDYALTERDFFLTKYKDKFITFRTIEA